MDNVLLGSGDCFTCSTIHHRTEKFLYELWHHAASRCCKLLSSI